MTPAWLKSLHLVVITPWGNSDDDTEPELLTRELRAAMTVVCELDDRVAGRWRRRLWVREC